MNWKSKMMLHATERKRQLRSFRMHSFEGSHGAAFMNEVVKAG